LLPRFAILTKIFGNVFIAKNLGERSPFSPDLLMQYPILQCINFRVLIGCLRDPANVQQTFSKCIQNTRANAGRLLDRVNIL